MEPAHHRAAKLGVVAWALVALATSAAFYWAVSSGHLTWATVVDARADLAMAAAQRPWAVIVGYVALFLLTSLLLFPAQLWVILLGAVLLGFERGFVASWLAAGLSSAAVFLLARSTLGGVYRRYAQRYVERMETAFHRDQFLYMLTLRLVPVFPYCIANLLPAALGARFRSYLAATAIGVVPYIAIYSFAGARGAALFESPVAPDIAGLSAALTPVLCAVAALPLLAIAVRAMRRRSEAA